MGKAFLFVTVMSCFLIFTSCSKICKGCPEAAGGELPTSFITINANNFKPADITLVRGNTVTFVNNTGAVQGVYSLDSIIIKQPAIQNTSSFLFKKDTVGTVYFQLAGKPAVVGSITFTP